MIVWIMGCIHVWISEWMNEWMRWIGGIMSEWMNEWMNDRVG